MHNISDKDKKIWNFYTSNLDSIKKVDKNKKLNTKSISTISKDLKPNIYFSLDSRTKRKLNSDKLVIDAMIDLHGKTEVQAYEIIKNWKTVKNEVLINCHDERPTTDVVYALANLLQDPLQVKKTEFEWFKFMHNKQSVNKVTTSYGNDNYLYPLKVKDKFYFGGYQQNRIVHYHDKKTMEQVDARIF